MARGRSWCCAACRAGQSTLGSGADPLEVEPGSLAQVFLGDFGEAFVDDHHAMPLGSLFGFAGAVAAVAVGGGEREVDDRDALVCVTDFRIVAEIADENDSVDAAAH